MWLNEGITWDIKDCTQSISNKCVPLTCCSRDIITSTAMLRMPSLVWGLSVFRCVIHILPSSLRASFMSRILILVDERTGDGVLVLVVSGKKKTPSWEWPHTTLTPSLLGHTSLKFGWFQTANRVEVWGIDGAQGWCVVSEAWGPRWGCH